MTNHAAMAVEETADAYSIRQFCQRHGISESFYHKLQAKGLGPQTIRLGTRVLISKEAAGRWRLTREAQSI